MAPFRYHSVLVTPTLSVATAVTLAIPDRVAPDVGEVIWAAGAVESATGFCTVTVTAELPLLPAASYARACRLHEPFGQVIVLQENVAGTVVLVPANAPFRYHSTQVTPTLSEAATATETVPDTVLALVGEVMVAVGGVVSAGGSVPPAAARTAL